MWKVKDEKWNFFAEKFFWNRKMIWWKIDAGVTKKIAEEENNYSEDYIRAQKKNIQWKIKHSANQR